MQVHGDYSEDVGVKLERPADETMAEAPAEAAAWAWNDFVFAIFWVTVDLPFF